MRQVPERSSLTNNILEIRELICGQISDCGRLSCSECMFDAPEEEFSEWLREVLKKESV